MKKQNVMRRVLWGLVSLLASVALWYYVVTFVSPNSTATIPNIPVTFSGQEALREQGLIITEGANTSVSLRVTGKRSDIMTLDESSVTVSVDVSKIRAADTFTRSYSISYPNSIQSSSITVDNKTPATVTFTVEALETKELPVKVLWKGTVAEEYMLDSCQPTVESIMVSGTKEQLEPMYRAIVILEEQGVSESFTRGMPFTVVDKNGEEVDVSDTELECDSIGVALRVLYTKQVPLAIAVESGGGATEANLNWEIDPPAITVSGEKEVLDDLKKLTVDTVSLMAVTEDTVLTKPIILPDGIRSESAELNAEVKLTLIGLSKKSISVSRPEFTNEPVGFRAVAVSNNLSVIVRGPAESLEQVNVGNIRMVADLSDFSGASGTYTCENVRIYVDGSDCGVIGTYTVVFNLMTEEAYLSTLESAD